MRKPSLADVDVVFAALAHEARRHVLVLLAQKGGALPSGYLAARFPHSWPTTTRHLGVLEEAGLVEARRDGRTSQYQLCRARLQVVGAWLQHFEPVGPEKTWPASGPRTTRGLAERVKGQRTEKETDNEHQRDPQDLPDHARGRRRRGRGGLLHEAPRHAR